MKVAKLNMSVERVALKLNELHSKLKLNNGNFSEEFPEQEMAVMFIEPEDVVLELGGNIGRNSCIIASLLADSASLVVFETDPNIVPLLKENRDLNDFKFHIEDCAISKAELYQSGWVTKTADVINSYELGSWTKVKNATWADVKSRYFKHKFDTLVADCEGALYYILRDEPTFLENFKKIIIENDFNDMDHKNFVDNEFRRYGFKRVYAKSGGFGPCFGFFYEVWEK
jgi:FkbM family methyltransferase